MRFTVSIPALVIALTASACGASSQPSPEYAEAMAMFDRTTAENLFDGYRAAEFDRVVAILRAVPPGNSREFGIAQALADDIERQRAAIAAQDLAAASANSMEARRPADRRGRANRGRSYRRPRAAAQVRPRTSSYTSGAASESFTRAANRARRANEARMEKQNRRRALARQAETKRKMRVLLEQKMDQRMNERLDKGNWKCRGSQCRTTVLVTSDEVE